MPEALKTPNLQNIKLKKNQILLKEFQNISTTQKYTVWIIAQISGQKTIWIEELEEFLGRDAE